ncbi:MAG: [FeFe] hydrogenase H-cluster radical SAM maturase HydE [Firmicutes bacterium]|nr:[FeFe] hydrogenase H-cluster radical SAM maturase HydE [Bacillota bacterium]
MIGELINRAEQNHQLKREEIVQLLSLTEPDQLEALFCAADRVRVRFMGNQVHLRGIIEFSNYCCRNCFYCGLRKDNHHLTRYRLSEDEIISIARHAVGDLGYRTIVLQSGEDFRYTAKTLASIIKRIKELGEVAVTVSVGERSYAEYAIMREAGADRYLLKHETADPDLYRQLHPDLLYENRLRCLQWLRELGYQVGSGNMVGLPGQTLETLADDILLLKELDVEMAGISPFVPHSHTPLGTYPGGTVELTLKVLAVTRLLMPYTHLPATTALGSIHPRGRELALRCGANVIMPNVTPAAYRPLYEIYPNKICVNEEPDNCRGCLHSLITSLGREVATDPGHSPKFVQQDK